MAIIFSYPTLSNLKAEDLLLVSDVSAEGKPTKNITVQQIVDLIPSLVPGGGTVSSVTLDFQNTGLTTGGSQTQTITNSGTFGIAGTLAQGAGGTGINTYSTGEILYTDGTSTLQKLTPALDGTVLTLSGGIPSWGTAASSGVTSITSTSSLTGMTLVSSPDPIIATGTITLGGKLKTEYGGTWDGTTGTWTRQLGLNYLTNAGSASLNQVLSIDSSGNAVFANAAAGVSSWSGGTTGLVSSGGDPATGAVVLGVGSKLISNNGGTGYSNTDLQEGDILYKGPSVLSRLPMTIGDASKVLTVNSAGTAPEWAVVPGGIGGSGTNGRGARWTSASNLADSAFFDEGTNVGLGVSPVAGQHFTIDSSLYSTSIRIINRNSAVGHIGINADVGSAYAGSQAIVGLQGVANGSSSGIRQGGLFISTTNSAGINIGITATAQNGGTGSHYAARFQDGNQAVGKYWKCVTSDGDGQWTTINDSDTTYDLAVKAQGGDAFATLALSGSDATTDTVKFEANNSAQINNDLVVYGDDATPAIAYAHKDLFTDAGGSVGQFLGVQSLTINSSGHIQAVTSEKFVGRQSKGISRELASFAGDSAAQVFAMPMLSEGEGKFGDLSLELVTAGTGGAVIDVAWYTGILGGGFSASNKLVTYGSQSVANVLTPASIAVPVPDANYQAAPEDKFLNGQNYIMVISIPVQAKLQSISQDGDIINGGCEITGWTAAQATLNGVSATARVAGSPLLLPANQWKAS